MSMVLLEPEKHFITKVDLSWSTTEENLETESDLCDQINIHHALVDTVEPIDVPNQGPSIEVNPPTLTESALEALFTEQLVDIDSVSEKMTQEDVVVDDESSLSSLRQLIQTTTSGLANSNISTNSRSDTDIGSRLKAAGAKTGDVQISISWNTVDDIDLHVEFSPGNGLVDHINWTNRVGRLSNGMLDIDMNANQVLLNNKPVENVFWSPNSAPKGVFNVYIHYFRSWTGESRIPVTVVIKAMNKTTTHNVVAVLGISPQYVTQFSTIVIQKRF